MGPPRRPAWLAAALGLAASLAAGDERGAWAGERPAIAVELPAAEVLPFTSAELESAVDARITGAGGTAPEPISLVWVAPDVLEVRAPARRRAVELGGARGAAAARLVALAIVDVVRPEGGVIAAGVAEPGAQVIAAAPPGPTRAPGGSALALAAWTAVNATATSAGLSLEPMVEAAWRLGGDDGARGHGLAAQVGYGVGRGVVGGTRFTLHFVPARLGAWTQRGRWGIGGGVSARPYFTAGLDGGRGLLWGGYLAGRAGFELGRGFGVLAIAGVEANVTAVDFRVGGRSLLRTGRLVPWAGAGLTWRPR